jgi:hypothetical protein
LEQWTGQSNLNKPTLTICEAEKVRFSMILNYLNQKTLLAATSELPQFVRYFILVYKKAYVAQKKYKQAQK